MGLYANRKGLSGLSLFGAIIMSHITQQNTDANNIYIISKSISRENLVMSRGNCISDCQHASAIYAINE